MDVDSDEIIKRIKDKEEILRKLKMVQLHRKKHDSKQLETLIKEWLAVCQQALQDLNEKLNANNSDSSGKIGISELLNHLSIEPELVGYSVEDETFTS